MPKLDCRAPYPTSRFRDAASSSDDLTPHSRRYRAPVDADLRSRVVRAVLTLGAASGVGAGWGTHSPLVGLAVFAGSSVAYYGIGVWTVWQIGKLNQDRAD